MYKCYLVALFLFTSCFVFAKTSGTNIPGTTYLQKHTDLVFVENKGQIVDQNNNNRNDIDYKIAGNGLNVFIGKGQLHYQFNKQLKDTKGNDAYRMDVSLVGANENAEVIAEELQEYYESYYLPQCWNNGNGIIAHTYKRISYKNIYPNIDWVLYIKDNQLEYDFVVHDGGDTKDIQIQYNGADKIAALENGGINAYCPLGKIIEQKPYSYEMQSERIVATNFELNNNVLSFNVEKFNGTLVIDPRLAWGTYYGGSTGDMSYSVGCDSNGYVYMTGFAASTYNIATTGTYRDTIIGSSSYDNLFVVKFNSNGVRQWGTYYGAQIYGYYYPVKRTSNNANSIAVDQVGNTYIIGNTNSSNYIATPGAYKSSFSGTTYSYDACLAKFNTNGALKWATYFGGNRGAIALKVSCNKFGHIYMCGYTTSDTGISSVGSFHVNKGGGLAKYFDNDGYLAAFDSTGNFRWATYYGGYYDDEADDVICDYSGNVFLGGTTKSDTGITSSGSFKSFYDTGSYTAGGETEGFLAKFDSSGNRLWGTYLDIDGNSVTALTVDTSNHIFVLGTGAGPYLSTLPSYPLGGGWRSYLAKFSSTGSRLWGFTYAGSCSDVVADIFGTVYIVGTAQVADVSVASPGSYQTSSGGVFDAFVARFTNDGGQRLWGTFYGGLSYDYGYGVACDKAGYVYICGSTASANGISTTGSHQPYPGTAGAENGFLAKFNSDTTVAINQPYIDTVLCKGGSFVVGYTTYMPFNTGNNFTVQLSDTNGNFSSPTNIGSITASTSGNDTCSIPSSAYNGKKYRIRIVASSPSFTSPDNGYDMKIISNIAKITASSNSPICPLDTLKLSATDSITGIAYNWTGPHSFTSTKQKPVINAATSLNSGEYIVTGSADGCTPVKDSVNVSVRTPPAPTASSNSPICYIDTLKLSATDSFSGITYHWLTPDSLTTTKQNPVLLHAAPGKYIVWVSMPDCISPIDSVNVVLTSPATPIVNITELVKTILPSLIIAYSAHVSGVFATPTYQWRKNGIDIPGATLDTVTLSGLKSKDVISVIIHATDPCSIPDSAVASEWPLDIAAISKGTITVQPNPTTGIMQIENAEAASYMIKDITGKKLMTGNISNQKENIDISGFAPGMYFLQVIIQDGSTQTFKVVKE